MLAQSAYNTRVFGPTYPRYLPKTYWVVSAQRFQSSSNSGFRYSGNNQYAGKLAYSGKFETGDRPCSPVPEEPLATIVWPETPETSHVEGYSFLEYHISTLSAIPWIGFIGATSALISLLEFSFLGSFHMPA